MKRLNYEEVLNKNIIKLFINYSTSLEDELKGFYYDDNNTYTKIEELVQLIGLKVKRVIMSDNESGKLDGNTIRVNINHHIHRQRFTLAHELGHYLLDHKGNLYRTLNFDIYTDDRDYQNELEANDFAAKILMPLKLINEYIEKFRNDHNLESSDVIDGKNLENLLDEFSFKFRVSKISLERRLKDLGILNYDC